LLQRNVSDGSVATECKKLSGVKAQSIQGDLSDNTSISGIVPSLENAGIKIDILVNCGGIQRRHKSEVFPDNDWNEARSNPGIKQ
jgi:2-deoxy-D-gluconate 3-dehydrogenase